MWRVRRVVTATDEDGKSYLLSEDIAGNYKEMAGMDGLFLTDLWETNGPRANNKGIDDAASRRYIWSSRTEAQFCGSSSFRRIRTGVASAMCRTLFRRSVPLMPLWQVTAIQ